MTPFCAIDVTFGDLLAEEMECVEVPLDPARRFRRNVDLNYDLDECHLGVMAEGEGADAVLRELAQRCDRRLRRAA